MYDDKTLNQILKRIGPRIDQALLGGVELREWWLKLDATDTYPNRYEESFVFNRPDDTSFGFLGTAPLTTGPQAVNGNVQQAFYDQPKAPASYQGPATEWIKGQVQEFVLRYFMRISDFRQPQEVVDPNQKQPPRCLANFSQCPSDDPQRVGFGFMQLFYKKQNGEVGIFPAAERDAIIDVRRLRDEFEWVVLQNPIFDFKFTLTPFGSGNGRPEIVLPLAMSNFLVMSRAFVVDEDDPDIDGVVGRYGLGYAFIKDPQESVFAYGPGELEPAFEQLNWLVMESGEILARFAFVANEPTAVLNISLDPLDWAASLTEVLTGGMATPLVAPFKKMLDRVTPDLRFDPVFPGVRLLNVATFGQAAERLCISQLQLKKFFLWIHFLQHYQTAIGSLQTWLQIPDWLDTENLPAFVVDGRSS